MGGSSAAVSLYLPQAPAEPVVEKDPTDAPVASKIEPGGRDRIFRTAKASTAGRLADARATAGEPGHGGRRPPEGDERRGDPPLRDGGSRSGKS